jgi:hypothetical protein
VGPVHALERGRALSPYDSQCRGVLREMGCLSPTCCAAYLATADSPSSGAFHVGSFAHGVAAICTWYMVPVITGIALTFKIRRNRVALTGR